MEFDYNSTRPKLILAEYGRNVQNMVDYICTLPTKEERNRYAQRDVSDFKHKLWDHLHIISDFKIDVDSPYPVPTRENVHKKPELLAYPQHRIRYKHYGHTAERMIEKAAGLPDGSEARQNMTLAIANFMKMAYVTWNKDSVQDDQIIHDLIELSRGRLSLPLDTVLTKLDFKTPPPGSRTKGQNNPPANAKANGKKTMPGKKAFVKKNNGYKKY